MALPFLNWLVDIMPDNSPSKRLVAAERSHAPQPGADAAILSHRLALSRRLVSRQQRARPHDHLAAQEPPSIVPGPQGYTGAPPDTLLRPSPRPPRPQPERRPRCAATPPASERWRYGPL